MPSIRNTLLCLLVVAAGCASAADRLAEGVELQSEGRYMEAAYRYADAIDKDDELAEAEERFLGAGDTAVTMAMESAAQMMRSGNAVRAAETFRRTDALFARGREVGVRLTRPSEYDRSRRSAFDSAIRTLMDEAAELAGAGEMRDAQRALVRARSDFAASAAQRDASIVAEIDLLLDWAEMDLGDGHYRAAFAHAAEAVDLESPPTREVARRADDLRNEALDLGTVRLAVLPVTTRSDVRGEVGTEYQDELADNLELDYWREPPPFVAVADPVLVRREVRNAGTRGRPLSARQVSRVMDEVGAEMGALIEITHVSVTAQNVRSEQRRSRNRNGELVAWTLERGRYVVEVHAEIVLVDPDGDELERFVRSARETGGFERGVYGEDAGELSLSRNEARYFDPDVLEGQRAEVRQAAVVELAESVADRVFSQVVARVR